MTVSGAEGTRTPDLLNAIQTLSQLSHSPELRKTPSTDSNTSTGGSQTVLIARSPFHTRDGAEGTRTPDLISAIDALSQLSYSPSLQE